jgi:hypothetical protein
MMDAMCAMMEQIEAPLIPARSATLDEIAVELAKQEMAAST